MFLKQNTATILFKKEYRIVSLFNFVFSLRTHKIHRHGTKIAGRPYKLEQIGVYIIRKLAFNILKTRQGLEFQQ